MHNVQHNFTICNLHVPFTVSSNFLNLTCGDDRDDCSPYPIAMPIPQGRPPTIPVELEKGVPNYDLLRIVRRIELDEQGFG